ncbi:MAG TPA: hypothetical protein VMU87_01980 [Stellaceae bacterium]|nr:hypothetical protein [Stellaceae bacterium]
MSMDLHELLSLLTAAREGSEYLDYAIQRALFPLAKPVPRYTSSLDAALLLSPEGWTIHRLGELSDCRGGTGGWVAEIYRPGDAMILFPCLGTAHSAALALCVAGMRTRLGLMRHDTAPLARTAMV